MGGKTRVVIVGGQFAGMRVQKVLESAGYEVRLVDEKEYFEFTPSVLRCLVDPSHTKNITAAHHSSVVIGKAVDLKTPEMGDTSRQCGTLVLEDGSTLDFEYLVMATGASYASPIKPDMETQGGRSLAMRRAELATAAAKLKAARRVVIVGGGSVGVELAAEVAAGFPGQKDVTLITSRPRLLDGMPRSASDFAEAWMRRHGVKLRFQQRVDQWPPEIGLGGEQELRMSSGELVVADACFNCTGYAAINVEPLQSLGEGLNGDFTELYISTRKGIPVLDTLQVPGYPNVFACGDAADLPTAKTAYTADLSASLVASNIVRMVRGEVLHSFPQGVIGAGGKVVPNIQCISLHRNSGILQLNSLVLTGSLPAWAKWMIEQIMMAAARGNGYVAGFWQISEQLSTWVGSRFFLVEDEPAGVEQPAGSTM